jgi:hypothetical protein
VKFAKHSQALIAGFSLVAVPAFAFAADAKKPRLDLRVMPRQGPPTTEFLFVAELKGGPDSEDFYCPTLEWDFGGGDTSSHEPECPPFLQGVTAIERRFSVSRMITVEGERKARVVLRKGEKVLGQASAVYRVTWVKKPPTGGVGIIR